MGLQTGIIQFTGSMGDFTWYKMHGKYWVRRKPAVDRAYMESRHGYKRTLENSSEFGNCAKDGKLLRQSLGPLLKEIKSEQLTQRVTALMTRIKNLDTISQQGMRSVAAGIKQPATLSLLQGFDFNKQSAAKHLQKHFIITNQGHISYTDIKDYDLPKGCTHASFKVVRLAVDFKNRTSSLDESEIYLVNPEEQLNPPKELQFASRKNTNTTIIYLLQCKFFKCVNNTPLPFKNGNLDSLCIVKVETESEIKTRVKRKKRTAFANRMIGSIHRSPIKIRRDAKSTSFLRIPIYDSG